MTPTARPKPARRPRRRTRDHHCLSAQLLEVIRSRGVVPAELARDAAVNPTMVRRFVAGERDVTLGTADRLAAALGLRLVEVGKAKARPRPAASVDRPVVPIPDHRPAREDESGEIGLD